MNVRLISAFQLVTGLLFLAGCDSSVVEDTGFVKLVDFDCAPVKNTTLVVVNNKLSRFLSAGHWNVDEYRTDEDGILEFDIQRSSDDVQFFYKHHENEKPSFMRRFYRSSGFKDPRQEIELLKKSTRTNPVYVYIPVDSVAYPAFPAIGGRSPDYANFGGTPGPRFSSGNIRNMDSDLMLYRFGKEGDHTILRFDAVAGRFDTAKRGQIYPITKIDSHGIEVGEPQNQITHIIDTNKDHMKYYVTYGSKKNAAIVSIRYIYIADKNELLVRYFSQLVERKAIDNASIKVNLEECGGYMDRGMAGFYTYISEDALQKVNRPQPARQRALSMKVEEVLDRMEYINTKQGLHDTFETFQIDERVAIQLFQYDVIKPSLFPDLYAIAKNKQWSSFIYKLGKDARSPIEIKVAIIQQETKINYIAEYISSHPQQAEVIIAGFAKYQELLKKIEKQDYKARLEKSLLEKILNAGQFYSIPSFDKAGRPQGSERIQEYLDTVYAQLPSDKARGIKARRFSGNRFTSGALLSQSYHLFKKNQYYKSNLLSWLNNENTPLSVLDDVFDEMDKGPYARNNMIQLILEHPNASTELREKIYSYLDTSKAFNHKLMLALASSKNTPNAVFEKIVAHSKEKYFHTDIIFALQRNPSLPVSLSEKLVKKYGCGLGVNDAYAKKHFSKLPQKNCFASAVLSPYTAKPVKEAIYREMTINAHSDLLRTADIPHALMYQLHDKYGKKLHRKVSANPNTPPALIETIFKDTQDGQVIENIAMNPATPVTILEKIFNNDYVSVNKSNHTTAKLACNANLSLTLRKHIQYRYPLYVCRYN